MTAPVPYGPEEIWPRETLIPLIDDDADFLAATLDQAEFQAWSWRALFVNNSLSESYDRIVTTTETVAEEIKAEYALASLAGMIAAVANVLDALTTDVPLTDDGACIFRVSAKEAHRIRAYQHFKTLENERRAFQKWQDSGLMATKNLMSLKCREIAYHLHGELPPLELAAPSQGVAGCGRPA